MFENTGRLKPELLRARLGRYLPQGQRQSRPGIDVPDSSAAVSTKIANGSSGNPNSSYVFRPRGRAGAHLPQAPDPDAPLTLDQPVDTLPVVADFRWNRAGQRIDRRWRCSSGGWC